MSSSFPTSLIGEDLSAMSNKWFGGVLGPDGCVYAAPVTARQVLKIDPEHLTSRVVGERIHIMGCHCGGAQDTASGSIYFAPSDCRQVLKLDVAGQTSELVGEKYSEGGPIAKRTGGALGSIAKWTGGALGSDGCVYFAPVEARRILKVDPRDDSTTLVGDDPTSPHHAAGATNLGLYSGVVASRDRKWLFFVPMDSEAILRYEVDTGRSTFVPVHHLLDTPGMKNKYWEGTLGPDGCLYCIPFCANRMLKYDPSLPTNDPDRNDPALPPNPTLVGDDLGDQKRKFCGGVLALDGCIYGIPFNAQQVLRYNPKSQTSQFIGLHYPGKEKWSGGVLDTQGNILAVPSNHRRVLKIVPSMFRDHSSHRHGRGFHRHNHAYEAGGIGESPVGADRLGYELYARVLVNHIASLEETGGAVSVGFLSPWGSGKSFFWNLTKEEFQRRSQHELETNSRDDDDDDDLRDPDGSNRLTPFERFEWMQEKCGRSVAMVLCMLPLLYQRDCMNLKSYFASLHQKLTQSPRWQKPYRNFQAALSPWRKRTKSCGSTLCVALSLLWGMVRTCLGFLLRVLCCCYRTGHWKLPKGGGTSPREDEPPTRIYVEFNSWTYRGSDNLWASMLEQIWRAVEDELGEENVRWHRAGIERARDQTKRSDSVEDRRRKATLARRRLQIRWNASVTFFAWALIAAVAAAVSLLHLFGSQLAGAADDVEIDSMNPIVDMGMENGEGDIGPTDPSLLFVYFAGISLLGAIAGLVVELREIQAIYKPGIEKITDQVKSYERKDFRQETGFMGIVKEEVDYLFDFLDLYNARIVLFVDDLDRCQQKLAMDALWAISLLFGPTVGSGSGPITSFLAVDTEILVEYIEADFDHKVNGWRYLEKIINLPFSIPPIDNEGKIKFCERAVDHRELQMSQVYRKALNYKIIGNNHDLVDHLNDDTLQKNNERTMLADLIRVGEMMNSSRNKSLANIEDELLAPSYVKKSSSRLESLKLLLLKNFDILEKGNGGSSKFSMKSSPFRRVNNANSNENGNENGNGNGNVHKNENVTEILERDFRGEIDDLELGAVVNDDDIIELSNATDSEKRLFYEYRSMFSPEERKFIKRYARFLDGVPRKINRILNVYNVGRGIAMMEHGGSTDANFLEKLFIFTILQEMCPYRTSWLVFVSQCAQGEENTIRALAEDDESLPFYTLLEDLKDEKQPQIETVDKLSLATVYTRIVCGLLHCLPNAKKQLGADSGVMLYGELLDHLILGDLFSGCLKRYMFNLPRSMTNLIKMYRNHCIIGKRIVQKGLSDDGNIVRKNYWIASFRKMTELGSAQSFQGIDSNMGIIIHDHQYRTMPEFSREQFST